MDETGTKKPYNNKYLPPTIRKNLPKIGSLEAAYNLSTISTPKHIDSLNFTSLFFDSKSGLSYNLHSMLIFTFII